MGLAIAPIFTGATDLVIGSAISFACSSVCSCLTAGAHKLNTENNNVTPPNHIEQARQHRTRNKSERQPLITADPNTTAARHETISREEQEARFLTTSPRDIYYAQQRALAQRPQTVGEEISG
ncbi:MAG: hypothetical protein O3A01_03655 [bacterium]|nr:hypothetical protein [bacterium]